MAPHDIATHYQLTSSEICEQLILNGYSPCPLQPLSKAITIPNWTMAALQWAWGCFRSAQG